MAKVERDEAANGEDGGEKSIEEQAEGIEESLGQLPIPGYGNNLTLDAGGNQPESATMKMQGGSLPVEGEFSKGDTVRLWIEGKVQKVEFVDLHDKNGFIVGTERRHVLRSVRVRRASADD